MLWAHIQSFSVRLSQRTWFMTLFIFVSETTPVLRRMYIYKKHRSFMFDSHNLRAKMRKLYIYLCPPENILFWIYTYCNVIPRTPTPMTISHIAMSFFHLQCLSITWLALHYQDNSYSAFKFRLSKGNIVLWICMVLFLVFYLLSYLNVKLVNNDEYLFTQMISWFPRIMRYVHSHTPKR